jgi:hypothetical protein
LGHQIYDSRDFSLMPILADALQDAGCDAAPILEHLYSPGPFFLGMYILDKITGRR